MALNYIIDQSKYFMNVGIVGLGKMGLLHTAILNTFDDVKVVSISEKENTPTTEERSLYERSPTQQRDWNLR